MLIASISLPYLPPIPRSVSPLGEYRNGHDIARHSSVD